MACTFFSGNLEASRSFLDEYGYMLKAISKSRFNRRLHAIDPCLWRTLFELLAEVFKHERSEQTYMVGSLPVAVYDNIRIRRSRSSILRKNMAKPSVATHCKQTPLLLRVAGAPGVVGGRGEPVEFSLAAGSQADVTVVKYLALDLPEGSVICADKGHTDYHCETLLEVVGLYLKAQCKKRSMRPMAAWESFCTSLLASTSRRFSVT